MILNLLRTRQSMSADAWMEDNAPKIGGRAILLIYKDGRPVYSKSVNEMSRKQKMVNKFTREERTA